MRLSDRRSIIAIDPTPRGIAFAFFEDGRLLDWGERLRRWDEDEVRIAGVVIDSCAAEVLVLEDADARGSRRHPRIRNLLKSLANHARRRRVTVMRVSRTEVLRAWAACGATNKAKIAAEIAASLPELAGVVPQRRGAGASEDPRMQIFDAASLVLHYDDMRRQGLAR